MTQTEALKMALECGYWSGQTVEMNDVGIERFADLVAQRQRDELITMFLEAYEGAKDTHNYWLVAANKIRSIT